MSAWARAAVVVVGVSFVVVCAVGAGVVVVFADGLYVVLMVMVLGE